MASAERRGDFRWQERDSAGSADLAPANAARHPLCYANGSAKSPSGLMLSAFASLLSVLGRGDRFPLSMSTMVLR